MTEKIYNASVLTVSDRCSKGVTEDTSGPLLCKRLEEEGFIIKEYNIVPDEKEEIESSIRSMSDVSDLVITTGGTGLSPRDVTPEATEAVCTKMIPGIAEIMRSYSMKITKRAALSRAVAGICANSLVINMPGSKKAVSENFDAVKDILFHAIDTIQNRVGDCGR
jgi:molybdopterin adenylyltransferase